MKFDLEDCIKDSFDDTMKTHMESDNYKEEGWEINKLYFELRNILSVLAGDIKHKNLTLEKKETDHGYIHPKNYNKHD